MVLDISMIIWGLFMKEKGIHHQSTCRDTPKQNGMAEHKNYHLLEMARSLKFFMHIPKYLWGEVILTFCYLINRMYNHILKSSTPLQCLWKLFPINRLAIELSFKVFSCIAYVYIPSHLRNKLDPRAENVFLLVMPRIKGVTNVSIQFQGNFISLWMFILLKIPIFLTKLLFRRREKMKISFGIFILQRQSFS